MLQRMGTFLAPPMQTTIHLVQKPTKRHKMNIEATIRDLKRRGFDLYERSKEEIAVIFDEVRDITRDLQ